MEEGRRCSRCCSRILATAGEATRSREREEEEIAERTTVPLLQQSLLCAALFVEESLLTCLVEGSR